MGGVLRAAAGRAPGQLALIAGEADPARRRQWSYGQLLAEAERARGAAGAVPARRPGGRMVRQLSRMGGAGVRRRSGRADTNHGQPGLPGRGARARARHSGPVGIFLGTGYRGNSLPSILAEVRARLPGLREVIPLGNGTASRVGAAGACPRSIPGPGADPVHLGHTGRPKGAVLTHQGLTNNARLAAEAIGMRAGESSVNPPSLFHIAGCGLLTLGLGADPWHARAHVRVSSPGWRSSSSSPTAARSMGAWRPC